MRSKIKSLLFTGLLLLSASVQAASFPTIPTLTVGNRVFTDVTSNLIILSSYSATNAHYSPLVKQNSGSNYQVTSGKTLTIYAVKIINQVGTGFCSYVIGYGTAATAAFDQAGAPTGATWMMGTNSSSSFLTSGLTNNDEYAVYFTVPATDYPAVQTGASAACQILVYGYET